MNKHDISVAYKSKEIKIKEELEMIGNTFEFWYEAVIGIFIILFIINNIAKKRFSKKALESRVKVREAFAKVRNWIDKNPGKNIKDSPEGRLLIEEEDDTWKLFVKYHPGCDDYDK